MLQASSTYEARSRARELKFLVSSAIGSAVLGWARAQLAPDPHGSGDHGDEYGITSLYFDTQALDVYHQRGSFGRGKYRARRYERATSFFLERKLRTERLLVKRRTEVDVGALEMLANANRDAQWTGHWFRRRLDARGLRPTCQVSYRRVARIGETAHGPLRLTCDREVRALKAPDFVFLPETGTDVIGPQLVLEMKFSDALPAVFKRLVEEFALEPLPVSKYRLSLDALRRDTALESSQSGIDAPEVDIHDA